MQNTQWCSLYKNNKARITLDNITSTSGYNQTIKTPIHFSSSSSSCIDLVFSSNMSYLTTGMEQSVYNKCHHNIIYGKLNFGILLPLPYYRKMWDYEKTNTEGIQRAISILNGFSLQE